MTLDFEALAPLAWAQFWQVSAVALVVGGVTRACCRRRPRLAYGLWMLVVIKSMVPPVWSSPVGIFSWLRADLAAATPDRDARPTLATPMPAISPAPGATAPQVTALTAVGEGPPSGMSAASLPGILSSCWLSGIWIGGVFVLVRQAACWHLIRRSRLPEAEPFVAAMTDLSGRLGLRRRVALFVISRPVGPAVTGILRPTVLLPAPLLAGMPPDQVRLILAHELIHVRRGDVVASRVQLVAQLLWWFHPLVWWANREARRQRERCCDQEVVAGVGCRPALYARTLLRVLEQKGRLQSVSASPGVRALEVTSQRLESIMTLSKVPAPRASLASRLVFAVGLAVLIPGAGLMLRADPPREETPKRPDLVPNPAAATDASSNLPREATAPAPPPVTEDGVGGRAIPDPRVVPKSPLEQAREHLERARRLLEQAGAADSTPLPKATGPVTPDGIHEKVTKHPSKVIAWAELRRALAYADWAEAMHRKGYLAEDKLVQAREQLDRANRGLEGDDKGNAPAGPETRAPGRPTRNGEAAAPPDPARRPLEDLQRARNQALARAARLSADFPEDRAERMLKSPNRFEKRPDRDPPRGRQAPEADRIEGLARDDDAIRHSPGLRPPVLRPDRPLASDGPLKPGTARIEGVVREEVTGLPVAGARVSAPDVPPTPTSSTVTEESGRFAIERPSGSRENRLVALPKPGDPYLIINRGVDIPAGQANATADLELVRGIPFRVRVLERGTDRPVPGRVSYFPIAPNNPFAQGVKGDATAKGISVGAFSEAAPDPRGDYLGAVLPGPGILGFARDAKPGTNRRDDLKPIISFPDGKGDHRIRFLGDDAGRPWVSIPMASDPVTWGILTLSQYDAVIVIDPRKGSDGVTYEIRVPSSVDPGR